MKRLLPGLAVGLLLATPMGAIQPRVERALLVSVDGMHAVDLARYVRAHPASALAVLARRGVVYANARTPLLGDSTPGLLSLATGGTPAVTGLVYSPFFDRSLLPPGGGGDKAGSVYYIDEKWVRDMTREDSGGGIDPARLPLDPRTRTPVYPHQLMRVNTMFEVVREGGGRTAWIDQHEMYNDLLRGPSGRGLDDSRALERKGTAATFAGFTGQDGRRVDLLLNQIRGLDSSGRERVGVPRLFGLGFISFGVFQKAEGYADAQGGLGAGHLRASLDFIDRQLGRVIGALKEEGLYDSTLIIVTSKHGQSPIDLRQRRVVDRNLIRETVNGVAPGLLAHASLDSIGLIWLTDSSRAPEVAEALRLRRPEAGIQKVYEGPELGLLLPGADADPRMPDLIVQPQLGVFFAEAPESPATRALLAEHGGMLDEDVNVPLLVSFPGGAGTELRAPVFTHQVAPTVLRALGLAPESLLAVQREGTAPLPGLPWGS